MKLKILVLLSILSVTPSVHSEDSGRAPEIGAKKWSVIRAVATQKAAVERHISRLEKTRSARGVQQERERQHRRETGFGEIADGPLDFLPPGKTTRVNLQQLRDTAPEQSKADSLNMTLRTAALGPLGAGGYIYVYDSVTSSYLGYSFIGSGGLVTLPVSSGQVVDLVVIPSAPNAFQEVLGLTATSDGDVWIEDAVEMSLRLEDADGSLLAGVETTIDLAINSRYGFRIEAATIYGSGSLYLSAAEIYDVYAEPEMPWLYAMKKGITTATPSLTFVPERGVLLTVNFDDPEGLAGAGGCNVDASASVRRSYDEFRGQSVTLSQPELHYDASLNLAAVTFAVPAREAVDLDIDFHTNSGDCLLQDYQIRRQWFAGDQALSSPFRTRPIPTVNVQTSAGAALAYDYVYFYPLEDDEPAAYYNGSNFPSLFADRQYMVHAGISGNYSVSAVPVTARAGPFNVDLVSDPLITVRGTLSIAGESYVAGLLEFYREGEPVAAFEYRGREMTMEIPAGTYDVRVSGLSASIYDSDRSGYYAVLPAPFVVERTFTGMGDERLDFAIDKPSTGLMFDLPAESEQYQLTAMESGKVVSSLVIYYYYDGVLTDVAPLELLIRGPGYPDVVVAAAASAAFPVVNFASLRGPAGRLQGSLMSQANEPLADLPIYRYLENGVGSRYMGRTASDGSFDVAKVKNGLFVFQAPVAGDSLQIHRPIDSPETTNSVVIRLPELAFHPVSESGPTRQLLFGTGDRSYEIAFLSEAYTTVHETFTDTNANSVWDGAVFLDYNGDGLWESGEPVETYGERVIDSATESGTDIRLLNEPFTDLNGDDYPSIDDFSVFVQNAKDYIRALLGSPDIAEAIEFDAYLVFLPSNQAGMDVIDVADVTLVTSDTRFDATLDLDRGLLSIDYSAAYETLNTHAPDRGLQVVLINQPVKSGRVNSYILAAGGVGHSTPNNLVAGHEFGHNPGRLSDEYDEFSGTAKNFYDPRRAHMYHQADPDLVPWSAYIGSRTDLPLSVPNSSGSGIYAGGSYNAGGAYRSSSNSRMRYNAPRFNRISQDLFRRSLCLKNLKADDFQISSAGGTAPSRVFADGFEPLSGVIQVLCD